MNNFICKKCKHCSKSSEIIVYCKQNDDVLFSLCDHCSILVAMEDLTENERKKLEKLMSMKEELTTRFYPIRNRVYTDEIKAKEMLKWKYVDQIKINDVSESCPFYAELFLFLENF